MPLWEHSNQKKPYVDPSWRMLCEDIERIHRPVLQGYWRQKMVTMSKEDPTRFPSLTQSGISSPPVAVDPLGKNCILSSVWCSFRIVLAHRPVPEDIESSSSCSALDLQICQSALPETGRPAADMRTAALREWRGRMPGWRIAGYVPQATEVRWYPNLLRFLSAAKAGAVSMFTIMSTSVVVFSVDP